MISKKKIMYLYTHGKKQMNYFFLLSYNTYKYICIQTIYSPFKFQTIVVYFTSYEKKQKINEKEKTKSR